MAITSNYLMIYSVKIIRFLLRYYRSMVNRLISGIIQSFVNNSYLLGNIQILKHHSQDDLQGLYNVQFGYEPLKYIIKLFMSINN